MNMKNGKKRNVETVQSTGDKENLRAAESKFRDNIIFRCSHPNSFKYVDFRVEPRNTEQRLNGHFHYLFYDSEYIVHKHNLEKNHVLTHKKYEKTLKEWLNENRYNWCETYRDSGVKRPMEDARKIIQGILNAVYKLHKNGSFHGFLHHPENFAIDSDELVIGGDHKEIKHISLIYANVECDQSVCLLEDGNPEVGMQNDIRVMSDVIFNQILRGAKSYPPDLCDLHSRLEKATRDKNELGDIVNHPSLWHWKSRFSYIGSVFMYYQHADDDTRNQMTSVLNTIDVKGWKQKMPSNDPLQRIFQKNTYRGESAYQLLRYLRNAHVHYKEKDYSNNGSGRYIYIDLKTERDYLNEKFIELKTTEIGGRFLVDLYDMMRGLSLEI